MNKKFFIPMLAAAAVGMATPALAQSVTFSVSTGQNYGYGYDRYDPYDRGYGYGHDRRYDRDRGHDYGYGYDRGIQQRKLQLQRRVERLAHRGAINRAEYRMFHRLFQHVDGLQREYSRNGLSPWERRELNTRLDRIQYNLQAERREHRRDRRYDRRW